MSGNSPRGQRAITVLARAPERGRVKTRLARHLGDDAALALHEALLLDVLEKWGQDRFRPFRVTWAMTGSQEAMARARELVRGFPIALETQCDGDLGARIEQALARRGHEAGGSSIVIGSDCPFLTDELLDSAAAIPERSAFLAPARDGGFVLLAAPTLPPGTLAGIDWGSERVLAQSLAALASAGLATRVHPESFLDIDEVADVAPAWKWLEEFPDLAPRSLAVLRAQAGLRPRRGLGSTGDPHPG